MPSKRHLIRLVALLVCASPTAAFAQNAPAQGGDAPSDGTSNGSTPGPSVVVVPAPAAPTYPGTLPPAGYNPDAHLPSSSRSTTDASRSSDGFDLGTSSGTGHVSVHGSASGQFISDGAFTPEAHQVRRGDTLWDLSSRYYQNPYQWPRLWAYNPQIQNPHWIYPGDQIRLRDGSLAPSVAKLNLGNRRGVPPGTVFLRDVGWVDDRNDDTWGELVGSPSDRMLLTEGDEVYIQLGQDHSVTKGQELTIFRPIRTVETKNTKGELVSIRGTVRVDHYNSTTHMVRARIVESLDIVERGVKIGPVGRKFDVVPPVVSDRDLDASILASVQSNHFFGQNQVVFIDRGEADGVRPGMRFFGVVRGDRWVQGIRGAGRLATARPRTEDDRPARTDTLPTDLVDEDRLPNESIAELRVVRVREHTAAALVVAAKFEIERNVHLYARKGL